MHGVYVTGLGVVSAIGNNVQECYSSLSECKHGIGDITLFDTIHKSPVGEVKLQTQPEGISRTSFLGLKAAKEALDDSGITQNDIASGRIRAGIVSSTTVGGMDISEVIYPQIFTDNQQCDDNAPSENLFERFREHPSDESTNYIANNLGITHYKATLSTACSSAANAILLGERLIKNNILDCVIVGGCDSLSKFTYNGFNSLKILSEELCRPFDDNRDGLNLGEGAGYIVLQNRATLKREPYCIVAGCANANDAYHQTASSENGEGDYLAMKQALEAAGLEACDINYINAHGTGTPNNDSSEFAAMFRIWGENMPPFSSTKCYTGHTLAAAGAIEAVFSILSITHGAIYANLNCNTTSKLEGGHAPERNFADGQKIKCVLSNSFGFGGNASTVIFSKVNATLEPKHLSEHKISLHNKTAFSGDLDIKALIPDANMRRRMSTIIKMGVATAMQCMLDHQKQMYPEMPQNQLCYAPDAIITTTWLGCLSDSEKFLKNLVENSETLLNPTPFIQSTFNAIGGQIALLTKNHCYNNTYTDRDNGLENALLDAKMLIQEQKAKSVLVGIINETTPTLEVITKALSNKNGNNSPCHIPEHGATFFIVS